MKIIVAPDKFKGSLTASEACSAICSGLTDIYPEAAIVEMPLADGGNGTAEILVQCSKGTLIPCIVHDPLFRWIESSIGISGDCTTAFVEMASASGLELLKKEERNCMNTSSFGTGELIIEAINRGVKKIILCIGGSATNDGGIGMAAALGYRFFDVNHSLLQPIGKNLVNIHSIDDSGVNPRIAKMNIEVACDVNNPLTGKNGASMVYGLQKGAGMHDLIILDQGLEKLARLIFLKYGISINNVPGSGAAGGLGAGAIVFLHAILKKGIEIVLSYLEFEKHLEACDLVITGEGKLDEQSLSGKVIQGILEKTLKYKIPVIAFAGKIELTPAQQKSCGLHDAYCINPRGSDFEAVRTEAGKNLRRTVAESAPYFFNKSATP